MEGYFDAVRQMEQIVMFPSLLKGVTLEEREGAVKTDLGEKDLYDYFKLLKSIKEVVESGVMPPEGQEKPSGTTRLGEEEGQEKTPLREEEGQEETTLREEDEEKTNIEGLFYYHVSGLYHVLTQLTRKADAVIAKYNEIVGQINQNRIVVYW